MNLYLRLLRYVKPYWVKLLMAVVCTLIVSLMTPVLSYLVKPFLDDVFIKKDAAMLYNLVAVLPLIYIINSLSAYGQSFFMGYTGSRVLMDIRNDLYEHIINLPLNIYNKKSTGKLMSKIINDVNYLGYLGNFTKSEIIKISKDPTKLVQIAPGIDTNHFMPRTASAKLIAKYRLEDRRIIVCVARLVHRKGQDQLIQAMPKILESHPDAILLLVGVGPIKQMLENAARQLRITHKIVFAGRISHDELPDYLAMSEIFAMPVRSRFSGLEVEGLGIVYLEASACGKPVVVGNSGGAADAVIDGVTGLLVDSSKVDEISNAICKLLDDPIKGKQMGEAGRDWVLANWQMSNWSKKFNKLLLDN